MTNAVDYSTSQLLGKVNDIIRAYYDREEMDTFLETMVDLLDLVDKGKEYHIAVERDTLRPYYVKQIK